MFRIFFQTRAQETRPVVRLDSIQRGDDVFECVSELAPVAVVHPEKGAREIVERSLSLRALANQGIDFEPNELSLGVIVFAALPSPPRNRASTCDDRIVRGVQ